ncbi:MAG: serine O-acetyltransferase EpsC [Candidatus Bathyarchaeia archaeon]
MAIRGKEGTHANNAEKTAEGLEQLLKLPPVHEVGDELSQRDLARLAERLLESYEREGEITHVDRKDLPSKRAVIEALDELLSIIFPGYLDEGEFTRENAKPFLEAKLNSVYVRLVREVDRSLKYVCRSLERCPVDLCHAAACFIVKGLLEALPEIRSRLRGDVQAAYDGDPAAKSLDEIILSYPAVYAIGTYRIAHELYKRCVPLIPRIMTEHAHSVTGIDIHPGAEIGRNFFIDHGTGVVIGETAVIGDNVRLYQGVTLGAMNFPRDEKGQLIRGLKRHPTVGNNVIIYSGATILGGETVIGDDSVIGGNVWLTHSVPPGTTVTIGRPDQVYRNQSAGKKP